MGMNRKLIAGLLTGVVAGGAAVAVAAPGGPEPASRPDYARLDVHLGGSAKAITAGKKPTLVYLQKDNAGTINPAAESAGGIGPYIDVALSGQTRRECPRVIDGGIVPSRTDVYQQGTYFDGKGKYHVLLGVNEETQSDTTPFTIKSSLICMRGVK